ncbi:hypothetical protein CSW53_25940 [Rhodococcus ruber]|nr:hypothetical protein CSW53_25940 [Rhodococcus ruber]
MNLQISGPGVVSTSPGHSPGGVQPDPPGAEHDDPRLLPPWRGSSSVPGPFEARRVHPQAAHSSTDSPIRPASASGTLVRRASWAP